MKKLTSVILSTLLCVSVLAAMPSNQVAADTYTGDNTYEDGTTPENPEDPDYGIMPCIGDAGEDNF